MLKSEIANLLTLVAAYDLRTVEAPDVEAWHAVAEEGRWPSFEVARRAVIKHHNARPDDRIMPGHISEIVAEAKRAARGSYAEPPTPTELRGDHDAQRQWLAANYRNHMDRYLAAWAAGDKHPNQLRAIS